MTQSVQYIPFARKYRPANFAELRGQEVLTKILTYSILNNRLAQAYLLNGIRGVGKTTSARIIAKTVNCENPLKVHNQNAKTAEESILPCEECKNCTSFNQQKHPDIIEIDAASRTGVDDIRVIIESSEYRPLLGQYKIFIIDEVHMLSKSAFNALLKVLEEPPAHIIFIFATTEVQKIPNTVISRCQRYDLRRFAFNEILQLVTDIASKEGIQFHDDALRLIAFYSEGSARDAVAMLDQSSSLRGLENDASITAKMVAQMFGAVDTGTVLTFANYMLKRESAKAVELVNELYLASANLENFTESVSSFIAHLSKAKALGTSQNELYQPFEVQIKEILNNASFAQLSILWQIFSKGVLEVKVAHNQLITLEMLVIQAIYACALPYLDELSSKEPKLEQQKPAPQEQQSGDLQAQIITFLKYLHQHNEIELYYFLLNQLELEKITDNVMEINIAESSVNHLPNKFKEKLAEQLFAWTATKWSVIINKKAEILTLKERLTKTVKSTSDWKILQESFPEANISDILLKV